MFPKLFTLGGYTQHTYGVFMAVALLVGLWVAARYASRTRLDRDFVWNAGVYIALAALIGSRLFYLASEWRYYSEHPIEIFSFHLVQAGGFFYGGLFLGLAVGIWLARRQGVSALDLADACFPGVALGLSIARVGCFLAGCCWGKASGLPWAVTFSNPYSSQLVGVPLGVPLHPTQLYEAFASLFIFGVLVWLFRRRSFSGEIFAVFLLLYSSARFLLEYLRDDPRGSFFFDGALSLPQVVSVPLFAVGALVWLWQRRRPLAAADAR
jgi:phosphatidylglycerol:prolipoprotein diacylglycerol transferase